MTDLAPSLAECRRIVARSRSSFRFAFRVLPTEQRQAMDALYAFSRLTDDLGDDECLGNVSIREQRLQEWGQALTACLEGRNSHPIHPALAWAVAKYSIPPQYLYDVIDGCASDLTPRVIATEDQLLDYCYRVASAVGLACIRIWGLQPGCSWDAAEPLAIQAGYAFQITNILRDLSEDAGRGRIYLPKEDLARFGVAPETWHDASPKEAFEAMLHFQVERARGYYCSSAALGNMLAPKGRAIHELMSRAYSRLLERIAQSGTGILSRRVRLSRWEKGKLLAGVAKAKLGLR